MTEHAHLLELALNSKNGDRPKNLLNLAASLLAYARRQNLRRLLSPQHAARPAHQRQPTMSWRRYGRSVTR